MEHVMLWILIIPHREHPQQSKRPGYWTACAAITCIWSPWLQAVNLCWLASVIVMTWNQLPPPPPWVLIGCLPQGSDISSHSMHIAADSAMKHAWRRTNRKWGEVWCLCVFKCTDSRGARRADAELFMEINSFFKIINPSLSISRRTKVCMRFLPSGRHRSSSTPPVPVSTELWCRVMQYQKLPKDGSLGKPKRAKLKEEWKLMIYLSQFSLIWL